MKKYQELLGLARESIESAIDGKELKVSEILKKKYSEKKACFVTLTIDKELRGCIGSLEPRQELWKDVVENSKSAAFYDPRFIRLTKSELKKIKIEISVTSIPKEIEYKDSEDLKKKIMTKGVIIQKDWQGATYLPQVWEDLPDFEDFISSLCQKAGLPADSWKNNRDKLEVKIYEAEKISE